MKKVINPIDLIYPLPVVLVTCCDSLGNNNIITVAWTTNLSRKPICLGITIGKTKYSVKLIKETMEFGVNIPGRKLIKEIETCGFIHGDSADKFTLTKLTKKDAELITPKLIEECPINIECKVLNVLDIGTSFFFVGEVLKVYAEEYVLLSDLEVDFKKVDPLLFTQKKYYSLGNKLGERGFLQKANKVNN